MRDRNDLALRFGQLKDSSLRPPHRDPLIVYACPAYLSRAGKPRLPAELAAHQGVFFRRPDIGRLRAVELAPASGAWQAQMVVNDASHWCRQRWRISA